MSRKIRTFAVSTFLLLLLAGTAPADVVHLKSGRRIVGTVEELGDNVRVKFDGGVLTVSRSQIEKIERAELPRADFERRLAALAETDADGALALAAFAEQAGLGDDAGRALARVAVHLPEDPRLRAALHRWNVHVRQLPPDAEGDSTLRAAIGPGSHLHVSPHFRIAHDVAPERARRSAEALEAAYVKVYEFAARLGIDAAPLDKRVDVLLYSDHARWVAAIGRPEEELRGLSGLYQRTEGRVYLFDTTTMPEARSARNALDRAGAWVAEFSITVDVARRALAAAEAQVADALNSADATKRRTAEDSVAAARASLRADEARLAVDRERLAEYERSFYAHVEREELATLTHEACHALAFASGICREGQPTWILEGVATLFEVTSRRTFLLDAVNEMRIDDLRQAWRKSEPGAARSSGSWPRAPRVAEGPGEAEEPAAGAGQGGAAGAPASAAGDAPGAASGAPPSLGAPAPAKGPSRLEDIVADAGFMAPPGERSRAYAEAWSLVWHLSRRRPKQFARLLEGSKPAAFDASAAPSRLADFRAAFGDDLATIEHEWRDDVGRVLGPSAR